MQLLKRYWSNNIKLLHFALLISFINFIFFHYPFFRFVIQHHDPASLNGIFVIISLGILALVLNAFVFYLLCYASRRVGKAILVVFFLLSALSVYFINAYNIIVDGTMMGNVFNTKWEEGSSFFSIKMVVYVLLLGVLPSVYIIKAKIEKEPIKSFLKYISLTFLFIAVLVFANARNWLWIDKNSGPLGGLVMPWSYTINSSIYFIHQYERNRKEILLPDATINDKSKAVVVLVIGESARKQNFSLYGYPKSTNPLLSKTDNLHAFNATSCATYTTAGVKCILEHANTGDLYEILPNYLERNHVDVFWRTSNWGEPPLHIKSVQNGKALKPDCKDEACTYDEILLTGLKEQIQASTKDKILVVLHTSTSHGPSYNKKYPPRFETFKPVCTSVDLSTCSSESLMNAYDNTIVYTDYLLSQVIDQLKSLNGFKSTMIFVSDHGESLGEKNLYMHGVPKSFAPKEQYEIPFIVWVSDKQMPLKPLKEVTQNHVFHSVMRFLSMDAPIYREEMNIFNW